jgi:predicted GIY-YIG superfamily endonuclease
MAGLVPAIHVLARSTCRLGRIQREHKIKHWSRKWKIRLIMAGDLN